MTDQTPSPQSVVVPVEPTLEMIDAAANAPFSDTRKAATNVYDRRIQTVADMLRAGIAAAPAPSSLAGGEVSPLVQRLAYGYAIMHTAICHMAGTSGASGRWYYDKANEAFSRVSPIHSITEESNPHVNGDYFSGLSNFLAALSPEAPARDEPVYHAVSQETRGPVEDARRYREHEERFGKQPALTPRHEAPAEGAGERDRIIAFLKERDEACGTVDADDAERAESADMILALRARSSAPEAREGEAVAWRDRFIVSRDGREWSDWNYHDEFPPARPTEQQVEMLYTHPAAPSADKLREFGQHTNLELSYHYSEEGDSDGWQVHRVNGGVNDREWDLIGSGATPADAIDQALAALKAEGEK